MPKKRFTPLKVFILGVMKTIPRPMSGYELITIAKEWRYDHYIKATNASFYYTLNQLQEDQFIKEIGSKQEGNRPEQKVYRLLNKGKKEFQQQMSFFLNQVQDVFFDLDSATPFILLYGSIVGKKELLRSINIQIEERKKLFIHADEGEKYVKSHFLFDVDPFLILPLNHWRLHNEAEIKWLEDFKRMVENIEDFNKNYIESINRAIDHDIPK
ncbi:MAG: PadR family transcriptional regulator [Candidatus Thorarchaeota archaeon]